jgi:hypothetical protein
MCECTRYIDDDPATSRLHVSGDCRTHQEGSSCIEQEGLVPFLRGEKFQRLVDSPAPGVVHQQVHSCESV